MKRYNLQIYLKYGSTSAPTKQKAFWYLTSHCPYAVFARKVDAQAQIGDIGSGSCRRQPLPHESCPRVWSKGQAERLLANHCVVYLDRILTYITCRVF